MSSRILPYSHQDGGKSHQNAVFFLTAKVSALEGLLVNRQHAQAGKRSAGFASKRVSRTKTGTKAPPAESAAWRARLSVSLKSRRIHQMTMGVLSNWRMLFLPDGEGKAMSNSLRGLMCRLKRNNIFTHC